MADYDEYAAQRPEEDVAAEEAELAKEAERTEATEGRCQAAPPSAAALRAQAEQMLADAAYLDRQEALDRQRARLARRPQMPDIPNPGDNATVLFRRYQNGKDYGYAAFGWREGGSVRWVVTGAETGRFNWSGLLEFIGEANWSTLHVVTEAERIGPDPEDETPLREVMGKYGRVTRTEEVQPAGTDPFAAAGRETGLVYDQGGNGLIAIRVPVRSPFDHGGPVR